MKFNSKIIILFVIKTSLVNCFADEINCKNNETLLSRPRRFLDFLEQTRIFFRVNYKVNVVTWGAIWAHASGWKANMNLLNDNKALRPFRRDTYEMLQKLLNYQGIDGQACILKAFCTATRKADGEMANGMLFKLLRHLFKLNEHDRRHFKYLKDENCDQILHHHCPLSFNSISPFTDDV
ncbi:uncharacterized protein LOC129913051 isoform X2 [Episyrphus balteatus]|uniref:uncharacterized protein LOC129913051 isoform X2 n=2 Tax=Episyrphus balteatus TaxID=286459 RepID=UPI002484E1C3|nr:uncharacterized protein LOC129913051 isoform X2 [Episyrphus balteatus]